MARRKAPASPAEPAAPADELSDFLEALTPAERAVAGDCAAAAPALAKAVAANPVSPAAEPAEEAVGLLAAVAELYADRDEVEAHYESRREQFLRPVAAKLEALEAKRAAELAPLLQKVKAAEEAAKSAVVAAGRTVKAAGWMAVYAKGRVSYDDSMLLGLAAALPAIMNARKAGKPSVTIRRDGKAEKGDGDAADA